MGELGLHFSLFSVQCSGGGGLLGTIFPIMHSPRAQECRPFGQQGQVTKGPALYRLCIPAGFS